MFGVRHVGLEVPEVCTLSLEQLKSCLEPLVLGGCVRCQPSRQSWLVELGGPA